MKNMIAMPMKWMAIESMVNNKFSTKSDVWSFGVCCWEIFSFGEEPYRGLDGTPFSVIRNLIINGFRLDQPGYCPNEIFLTMKQCWDSDPDKRPTFSELVVIFSQSINSDSDTSPTSSPTATTSTESPPCAVTVSPYSDKALFVASGLH